jgi:hypothetical protein
MDIDLDEKSLDLDDLRIIEFEQKKFLKEEKLIEGLKKILLKVPKQRSEKDYDKLVSILKTLTFLEKKMLEDSDYRDLATHLKFESFKPL